jgi:outer membrane lipoprotein SlyB
MIVRKPSTSLAFVSALLATLALPLVAHADAIPSGTTITGVLQTPLDSGKARIGDGVSITVTRPYPDGDASYANATIRGHVSSVTRAGQGRKAEIDLAFDTIVLGSGASSPISGHVLNVQQKKKSAIITQAAGAGIGMIVGNVLGKAVGSNLGGFAGAAGGFLYANNVKQNFTVPANSTITLQTDATVERPQARY